MKTLQKRILRNGEAKSTCSRQGFHASRSVLQDSAEERTTTATCGRRLFAQYGRYSPLGSLVRTLLASSRWYSPARRLRWDAQTIFSRRITYTERSSGSPSTKSARVLSVQDMPSSRLLFRLVPSERPTAGTGYGLLLTVQTQGLKINVDGKTEFMPLDLLPTPCAQDGKNTTLPPSQSKRSSLIGRVIRKDLLPTPMVTDIHHARRVAELKDAGGETFHSRANGETRPNGLTDFLDFHGMLLTPSASDGMRANFTMESLKRHNKKNAENSNLSEQIAHKVGGGTSQLNPLFVTEMMGFPSDWLVLPFQGGGPKRRRRWATHGCRRLHTRYLER